MFPNIVFSLFFGAVGAAHVQTLQHTLTVVDLLRSNARGQFESETHLHSHVSATLDKLLDESLEEHTKQNNFIISIADGFDVNSLKELNGPNRFSIIYTDHYQVSATPAQIKSLLLSRHEGINGIVPVVSAMKIESDLSASTQGCEEDTAIRDLYVEVAALAPDELISFRTWLDEQALDGNTPFSYTHQNFEEEVQKYVKFSTKCASLASVTNMLAERSEVVWIEEFRQIQHYNNWARGVMESGIHYDKPIELTAGLTGGGQIIGISDTGLDMSSIYFYDNVTITVNSATPNLLHRKIVSYTSKTSGVVYGDGGDEGDAHGTHVSGIAAGKAYENYGDYARFNGAAYDAKIAFFDIEKSGGNLNLPSNLDTDLFGTMYSFGATIFSNSWGESTASYDAKSVSADRFMVNRPETLILFANGNSGDPAISGKPAASSVGSPAVFKNGLSVGAGLNDGQTGLDYTFGTCGDNFGPNALAKFSSRGPTADGRTKPEVLAPGFWVTSAEGRNQSGYHTGVTGKTGTSMATPAAAGIAAVIRQYFMSGYYFTDPQGTAHATNSFIPSGALLKAIIIASAQKVGYIYSSLSFSATGMTPGYPNNDQGYGRIQVNKVLHFGAASLNPLNLFVIGDTNTSSPLYKQFNASNQVHKYTFRVNKAQSVRVVLAYTDPTAGTSSSKVIINDLDVYVSYQGGALYPVETYKNTFKVVDAIQASPEIDYNVIVTAKIVNAATVQPYALVIVGDVSELPSTTESSKYLQSVVSVDDIPFTAAIITMAVVSFLIFVAIVVIIVANRCPSSDPKSFFAVRRW